MIQMAVLLAINMEVDLRLDLYSLNNYINISQLNAALYGVCPLQDRVKSLRLGRHDYMQHTEIGKDALR